MAYFDNFLRYLPHTTASTQGLTTSAAAEDHAVAGMYHQYTRAAWPPPSPGNGNLEGLGSPIDLYPRAEASHAGTPEGDSKDTQGLEQAISSLDVATRMRLVNAILAMQPDQAVTVSHPQSQCPVGPLPHLLPSSSLSPSANTLPSTITTSPLVYAYHSAFVHPQSGATSPFASALPSPSILVTAHQGPSPGYFGTWQDAAQGRFPPRRLSLEPELRAGVFAAGSSMDAANMQDHGYHFSGPSQHHQPAATFVAPFDVLSTTQSPELAALMASQASYPTVSRTSSQSSFSSGSSGAQSSTRSPGKRGAGAGLKKARAGASPLLAPAVDPTRRRSSGSLSGPSGRRGTGSSNSSSRASDTPLRSGTLDPVMEAPEPPTSALPQSMECFLVDNMAGDYFAVPLASAEQPVSPSAADGSWSADDAFASELLPAAPSTFIDIPSDLFGLPAQPLRHQLLPRYDAGLLYASTSTPQSPAISPPVASEENEHKQEEVPAFQQKVSALPSKENGVGKTATTPKPLEIRPRPSLVPVPPAAEKPPPKSTAGPLDKSTKLLNHKAQEKKRRESLRQSFDELRGILPPLAGHPEASKKQVEDKVALMERSNKFHHALQGRLDRRDNAIALLRSTLADLKLKAGIDMDIELGGLDLDNLDAMEAKPGTLESYEDLN